jgi:hypothetical protein
VIEDTHANRLANYPPGSYAVGTLFWETDRSVFYLVVLNVTTPVWEYASGQMNNSYANLPTDLASANTFDNRFLFHDVTYSHFYMWRNVTAGGWVVLSGVYEDVLANRPTFTAGTFVGFTFRASDYGIQERWNGTAWEFVSGDGTGAFVALATMATVFGNPEKGFTWYDTDYKHVWFWEGSGWNGFFAAGQVVMSANGSAPPGGVFYPCDGGTYTVPLPNATTTSITTENLNGTTAAIFAGGFSSGVNAASSPTWASGAKTDTHTHTATVTNNANVVVTGVTTDVVSTQTVTTSATAANLSNANAVINPPSVANGGLPAYFRMSFWLQA